MYLESSSIAVSSTATGIRSVPVVPSMCRRPVSPRKGRDSVVDGVYDPRELDDEVETYITPIATAISVTSPKTPTIRIFSVVHLDFEIGALTGAGVDICTC